MKKRWDIFCHVVDNFGDVGVCWRLARQLVAEFDIAVRLWIDDIAVLKKIRPDVATNCAEQIIEGVRVCHWSHIMPTPLEAADVVIEAFACELPDIYRAAMHAQNSLWINLEYLSAEDWVAGCHGLPSLQSGAAGSAKSLKKYFFFPGFSAATGGVLGERELPARRRQFQTDAVGAQQFLQRFGCVAPANGLTISLFSYQYAPIAELLQAWTTSSQPILCLVPEGQPLLEVSRFFGETLLIGAQRSRGNLSVAVLPFLTQDDYDRLLWSCDVNFVRGEDSFVRAQWAARPFVWHIYAQDDGAHWPKLNAFLDLYGAELENANALHEFWRAWNGAGDIAAAWLAFAQTLPALHRRAETWAKRLESGANLAAALVQFCANQV